MNVEMAVRPETQKRDYIVSFVLSLRVGNKMTMANHATQSLPFWLLEKQCLVLMGKSNSNDRLKTSAELNISLNTAQLEKQTRSGFKTLCC